MITLVVEKSLQELHVPYTYGYLHGYMERLPLNKSLWAIKKVLDHYSIDNDSYNITDKTSIIGIKHHFIAQTSEGFVAVRNISSEYVTYFGIKGKQTKPLVDFIESWSGVVLICRATASSSEPDYFKHRRAALLKNVYRILTAIAIGFLIAIGFIHLHESWTLILELLTSITGLGISVLLLKKHLSIPSPIAERLCGIVKNGKCDEPVGILPKNPLFKSRFDLSEIGISFFAINSIAILVFSESIIPSIYVALILAFPLSIWSIGWQLINNSWCVLCTMVMFLLWIGLGILIPKINLTVSAHLGIHLMALFCSYWIILQAIHTISEQYIRDEKRKSQINSLQRAKYDKETWTAILTACEVSHPIDEKKASSLLFGNKVSDFPLITIVGNPFCAPCARMHHRVQSLV